MRTGRPVPTGHPPPTGRRHVRTEAARRPGGPPSGAVAAARRPGPWRIAVPEDGQLGELDEGWA
ncbi:hypothetical protein ACFCZ6_33715, partial [Streptomyces hydrogenans]|uniref:hypothetical protein n=1 Tax=Streptomyces hydrogenans TaxID=1873719 RepID=UPI0035DCFF2F